MTKCDGSSRRSVKRSKKTERKRSTKNRKKKRAKRKKKVGKSLKLTKTKLTKKKAIKFYNLLKVIEKLSSSDFNILSQYLDEKAYDILSECIHNTICSKSIDDKTRTNLRKVLWSKKNKIRYLADKTKPFARKKKIIPQIGGNIGLIIGTVLPLIYNFLRSKKII